MKLARSTKFSAAVIALGASAAFALAGCGNSAGTGAAAGAPAYSADLTSLNGSNAAGSATLSMEGGQLRVALHATGLEPNIAHATRIRIGSSCPTAAADANHDGIIDAVEAASVYGDVMADLSGGDQNSISADAQGNLTYEGVAPVSALTQNGVANAAGESLDMNNRVIVIEGVSDSASLPSTVAAPEGTTPQASLPIACGVLRMGSGSSGSSATSSQNQSQAQAQAQQQVQQKQQQVQQKQQQVQQKQQQVQQKQQQVQQKQQQVQQKQQQVQQKQQQVQQKQQQVQQKQQQVQSKQQQVQSKQQQVQTKTQSKSSSQSKTTTTSK